METNISKKELIKMLNWAFYSGKNEVFDKTFEIEIKQVIKLMKWK